VSKEKWKRNIRRWPALALTLVMTLSIAACGAARGSLAGQAAAQTISMARQLLLETAGRSMKVFPIPKGRMSTMTRL
jgi:hypothetical protein